MFRRNALDLFSAGVLVCSLLAMQAPAREAMAQEGPSGSNSQKQAIARGVTVWDTGSSSGEGGREFAVLKEKSRWARVPPGATEDYRFNGDCVVENEHLWLYLPAGESSSAFLWGKTPGGAPRGIALHEYDQQAQRSSGPKSIRIVSSANHEATVEYGATAPRGRTVRVEYRVAGGKHWIEAKPAENAGGLGIGIKSQLVIVPGEFGEDYICDSLKQKAGSKVPLPHGNLVIALNCDGNFMSALAYPSVEQAGDVLIGSDHAVSNHGQAVVPSITAVNARFRGKSIFVGLLPHPGNWYYERINKIYSSSGQYISDWKPSYPGTWRLAGRVRGRYRVNDASGSHFIFACSWSGTFEHLFMYLYARSEDTPADIVTPMDVYRETVGAGPDAYLLQTEDQDDIRPGIGPTKHRDVCGTVNDLKATWKDHLDRIEKDPDYISNLAEDAKSIMGRLESRLNEYRRSAKALASAHARIKETQGSAEYEEFANGVRECCEDLDNVKPTRYLDGCRTADEIERISREQSGRLRTDREHLDKLAEEVRAVAQSQENKLKEYRKITARLSRLCQQKRETKQEELKYHVTVVGRLCGRMLRNRDAEE